MSATGVQQPAADYLDSTAPEISISVVSHAQIGLVMNLLNGLQAHCQGLRMELILTLNLEAVSYTHLTLPTNREV